MFAYVFSWVTIAFVVSCFAVPVMDRQCDRFVGPAHKYPEFKRAWRQWRFAKTCRMGLGVAGLFLLYVYLSS